MNNQPDKPRLRRWLFLPPALVGAAAVVLFVLNKRSLERTPVQEESRVLRVIPVPEVTLVPRVLGYGTAEPARVWRAVAEVRGRVIQVHEQLSAGTLLRKGAEILRIDPREFELRVSRLEADIEQVRAQLKELEANEANHRASLAIEKESLTIAERRLDRNRRAAETQAVAKAQVEAQERVVLTQRLRIQEIENALRLVPAKKKVLDATLAVKQASQEEARLDLERTVITAPFDCRLAAVDIEKGQFLKAGEQLFEAHSIEASEVEARVSLDKARALLRPEALNTVVAALDVKAMQEIFDFDSIVVRRIGGDLKVEWDARFDRIRELIDPATRTAGLVVRVDRPYARIIPGKRPPLLKGMFCEVEFRARPRTGRLVVPRSAVRDGHVYVVGADHRLRRKKVEIAFTQSDFVALRSGVSKDDVIVVSDPTPAVEGMLVEPVVDRRLLESVVASARGQGSVR